MRIFLTVYAVMMICAAPVFADSTPWAKTPPTYDENLYRIYQTASQAERNGALQAARDSYTIILSTLKNSTFLHDTPLQARALYRRGLVAYKIGDTVAAFQDFDRILSDFYSCEWADRTAFQMGQDAEKHCDQVKAIEYYRMIIDQRVGKGTSRFLPQSYWGWMRCARICHDDATVDRVCEELIQKCPTSPEADAAKSYLEGK